MEKGFCTKTRNTHCYHRHSRIGGFVVAVVAAAVRVVMAKLQLIKQHAERVNTERYGKKAHALLAKRGNKMKINVLSSLTKNRRRQFLLLLLRFGFFFHVISSAAENS
ncbi:hypothetical protein TRVL_05477 [Trypanosoma vivax]|nr:hypothetical protein TRVL_05477 [Trypanosoma vivax]